jgi:hypothetical protein
MKNIISVVSFYLFFIVHCSAQSAESSLVSGFKINLHASSVILQHKNNLTLTLVIDSIILDKKTITPNFKTTIPISFESGFIHVNDSLYIKIFIARNQEYGSKFYTWKWDYLKKQASGFVSMGQSTYEIMDFNGSLESEGVQGHGIGVEGTEDYMMYYYRYKLE